jgi:arylsulfatase
MKRVLFASTIPLLAAVASLHAAATEVAKPNFIIILADDMGYSDAACYGGEIATPAIDRLAAGGVRLSRFHNGGMCDSQAGAVAGSELPSPPVSNST